jgi:pimeloyl-ACP methyl ester carboxylesterase
MAHTKSISPSRDSELLSSALGGLVQVLFRSGSRLLRLETLKQTRPLAMRSFSSILRCSVLLSCLHASALAYTLQHKTMAREIPSGCEAPATVTTFPVTAQRVYVWFYATGVATTDEFRYQWVTPQGLVRSSGVWARHSGEICYWAWITPDHWGQETGKWVVRVSANGTRLFEFSFRLATVDEACPVLDLAPTSSYKDELSRTDCLAAEVIGSGGSKYVRRYRIHITTAGLLRVDLLSGDFDSYLYFLGSDGVYLDSDDDSGDGTDARIVRFVDPGDYLIVATSYEAGSTGSFQLRSRFLDPASCGVTDLDPTGSVSSVLSTSDCPLTVFVPDTSSNRFARQFRIVLPRPGTLTIDLTAEFDTYLYLMTSRYEVIDYDDDGGAGLNSRISRRMAPGVYYVIATSYYPDETGSFTLQTRFDPGEEIITLFLHGLNSDAGTWRAFNRDEMGGQCRRITSSTIAQDEPVDKAPCYLYTFDEKTVDGTTWGPGDGSTFSELGAEVRAAVEWIRQRHDIRTLILVGHSRGGLAARAYLQSLETRLPFWTGLFTIGTPHMGSPFGRTWWWLRAYNRKPSDENCTLVPEFKLKFIYSPSTGYLATSHDSDHRPRRAQISEAIWALNDGAPMLLKTVDLFGELRSGLLKLGENISGSPLNLDDTTLAGCLTKNDKEKADLLAFVESNLPDSWLNEGDGIVPFESQRIISVLGEQVSEKVWYIDLKQKTAHSDETSRTAAIKAILDKLISELDRRTDSIAGTSFPSSYVAGSLERAQSRMEESRRSRTREVIETITELRSRHGGRFRPELDRAEDLAHKGDFTSLYELGAEMLPWHGSAEDEATQIALKLLALSGTKKAVARILATVSRESGWDVEGARRVGADIALSAHASSLQVLRGALFEADPRDLVSEVATEALLRSPHGEGVPVLLEYLATLSDPTAIRIVTDRLSRMASTRSITALRKLIPTVKFESDDARLAVKKVAADLEAELVVKSERNP